MEKKILIIADSLAMPRGEVPFEMTWPYMLQSTYRKYYFIDKTRRASTSERLVEEGGGYKNIERGADLLEHYKPNVVITQIGITDCSPRYLKKASVVYKLINYSPNFLSNVVYYFLKKYARRKLEYADVSLDKFRKNWLNYIERAKMLETKIICLAIAPPTNSFINKSPEISEAIIKYNSCLEELSFKNKNFNFIQPFSQELMEEFAIDELHVGSKGHKHIYNTLKTFF
ncbi:hypothetical protein NO995_05900 [Aestuariibaculum sp. M13]|uniref:hypothetical protein n=1 Tax=Aestuariibaculum sp. M13 TaxID=2967132 RepID=UPI00215A093A|nr:hypothetical protein [Aestuariibaculum sp. M13]MCR8667205.1 hypothetical protein [Aestuariibaculum sp. M13]